MKQDPIAIKKGLQQIVEATEKLDFPLMSTLKIRQTILQEEKSNFEAQIGRLVASYGFDDMLSDINCADLWAKADAAARTQFGNISEKQMLNGFYLQEVMHRYTELISKAIIQKVDQEEIS